MFPNHEECMQLVHFFQTRPETEPFLHPVMWKELELYDYPEIITEPMDLSTVNQRLASGHYNSVKAFSEDMRRIWHNAILYNRQGSAICESAKKLQKLFERKIAKLYSLIDTQINNNNDNNNDNKSVKQKLSEDILLLDALQLNNVSEIVYRFSPQALIIEAERAYVEIDVSAMDEHTTDTLIKYVKDCLGTQSST